LIGGVVGGVAGGIFFIFLIWLIVALVRKNKKKDNQHEMSELYARYTITKPKATLRALAALGAEDKKRILPEFERVSGDI
jgi:hypothetical protein